MYNKTVDLSKARFDSPDYDEEIRRMRFEFYSLIANMVEDILLLEEDLVRWRKALIPHLTPDNAEGLKSDILDGMARNYEGTPAYDMFIAEYCNNNNPMENDEHCSRMIRLRKGIDETSVFLK